MLQKVLERRPTYNNNSRIASSSSISNIKLSYYRALAASYGYVGRCADYAMANSSWTMGHLTQLWGPPSTLSTTAPTTSSTASAAMATERRSMEIVFPPCNTRRFLTYPLHPRRPVILSVGQFRPEKDHRLQIMCVHVCMCMHVCCRRIIG